MGDCCSISDLNANGTINVDIPNNLTTQNFKNKFEPTNQNNDECSILISSYSNEQNYSVKYKESNIKQIYEKNKKSLNCQNKN